MFKRLQEKWGVSTRQFWILFIVFGLTGTTTAVLTRYITTLLGMDASTYWLWRVLLRIGMLVFGYQVILLTFGALLGQWSFFWKYEKKLLVKLGILSKARNKDVTRIAIFASGAGSNAAKIIDYLEGHRSIKVALIVCNKPGAGVLQIAASKGVPSLLIEKERFFSGDAYLPELKKHKIDFIVLAGFLWKVPVSLIAAFPNHIINIHPALLPKYGGKGMYGMKVHEAVLAAGEKESGITIHYVNEHFDEGEHIFQAKTVIEAGDTPESLAQKIHALEHAHFPETIERVLGRKS
ncbi:phosphoribosylglycinamide formyltransferase [Sediminibacterium roseum]|nr:phosphoribosylglycinamide formyltransferase [Sediminibacterium roseum]